MEAYWKICQKQVREKYPDAKLKMYGMWYYIDEGSGRRLGTYAYDGEGAWKNARVFCDVE